MKISGSPAYVRFIKGLIDHQKKSFEGRLESNNKLFKEESPEVKQMRELLKNRKKALEKFAVDQTAKKMTVVK